MKTLARVGVLVVALVALAPQLLPLPGTFLVVDDVPQQADTAVVLDAVGTGALDGAEQWRQAGLVRDVVVVEAPVKTHGLIAYWSDFVAWGIAPPARTPSERLRVVRSTSGQPADQARAALPALQALGAHSMLAPGGGIGSRVAQRELASVLEPAGIRVSMARMAPPRYDAARWYEVAEGRRAVLDLWLQLLVPYVAGGGSQPSEENVASR
jgi:hypothetical protein